MRQATTLEPVEPLQLSHSWPLFEAGHRFNLGRVFSRREVGMKDAKHSGRMPNEEGGAWDCDLANNALTWSTAIYELFGLPRNVPASRDEAVALYAEHSRVAMERLRAHAIRHHRGFTLDAEIHPIGGRRRWMRLVAAPVCDSRNVIRLYGRKADVTHEYK